MAGEVLARSRGEELGPGGGALVGELAVSVVKEEAHDRGGGGVGDSAVPVDEVAGVVLDGVDAVGMGEGPEHSGDGVVVHGVAVVEGDSVGSCEHVVGGGDEDGVAQDEVGDEPLCFVSPFWGEGARVEGCRGGQEVVLGGEEMVGVHRAARERVAPVAPWPPDVERWPGRASRRCSAVGEGLG